MKTVVRRVDIGSGFVTHREGLREVTVWLVEQDKSMVFSFGQLQQIVGAVETIRADL